MPQLIRAAVALLLLAALPTQAERNLVRPPGTTRYTPMLARLRALLTYDQTRGAHRMALSSLGQSVKGRDIWMVTLHGTVTPADTAPNAGDSPHPGATADPGEDRPPSVKRLFYLCRQHGHEPASTEGALAFIDTLVKATPDSPLAVDLERVTVDIVPMANPDGAEAFLRHNAHNVDLNRDWLRQTQPETRAWLRAIQSIRPDLMTDQHELYPDDTRWDFTETAGVGSGASTRVMTAGLDAQSVIQGAMQAEGFATVRHVIQDRHPARLAHRYASVVAGVPTILFETSRLTGMRRSVAARAAAHEQFMTDVLRDLAGEQDQLEAESQVWQRAHARNSLLASRKKGYQRAPVTQEPEKSGE